MPAPTWLDSCSSHLRPDILGLETARDLGKHVKRRAVKVALTVDADDATLADIVEVLQPDILQLHGRETVARLRDIKQKFGLQVMKALAVETAADLASLQGYAAAADRILFDAVAPKEATRPGGLGAVFGLACVGKSRSQTAVHGLGWPQCRQCRGCRSRDTRRRRRCFLGCRALARYQGCRDDPRLYSRRACYRSRCSSGSGRWSMTAPNGSTASCPGLSRASSSVETHSK